MVVQVLSFFILFLNEIEILLAISATTLTIELYTVGITLHFHVVCLSFYL